jgi:glycosyltransferase involved in cell wall biosynthesis
MNIAVFHELPEGGAKNATIKIANLLKTFGHNVDLYYVAEKRDSPDDFKLNNVFFYEFKPKPWVGNNWKVRLYKDTVELFKIYKLDKNIAVDINSKKYDFVLVNASQFIEAPFIFRFLKPFKIFYAHDPNYRIIYEKSLDVQKSLGFIKYSYEKTNRFFRRIFDSSNIMRADLILANSEFAKDVILKTYNLKSELSYLGVDSDIFKPQDTKKDIDILFVGSKDPIDGYPLLSGALKLIGNKLNVVFVPGESKKTLSLKEMAALYQKSKIVVCLSVNEPFGLVPLEAMACEVPVVAINEGGYSETVINNKTGFLIKRDEEELAKKIKLLLNRPELVKEMGENGREEVLAKWTWEKRGKELEKILLKVYGNINNNC